MAKIKNVFGEDRTLPWLGNRLVLDGQVVEVPDEDVYAYTQQSGWEPADDAAQGIHDEAAAVAVETVKVESGEPAGNASREDWVTFVTGTGRATPDELDGLSRDEIRDTYKEQA